MEDTSGTLGGADRIHRLPPPPRRFLLRHVSSIAVATGTPGPALSWRGRAPASNLERFPIPSSLEAPMVSLGALWLPIVLSAVLVFVLSSIIHMVLGYHNRDYTPLPNEDAVRAAIRSGNPAPEAVRHPLLRQPKEMGSPRGQAEVRGGSGRRAEPQADGLVRHGSQPGPVVRVLAGRVVLRGLRRVPRAAGRERVSPRVPDRGRGRRSWPTRPGSFRRRSGWASRGRSRGRKCSTGWSTGRRRRVCSAGCGRGEPGVGRGSTSTRHPERSEGSTQALGTTGNGDVLARHRPTLRPFTPPAARADIRSASR